MTLDSFDRIFFFFDAKILLGSYLELRARPFSQCGARCRPYTCTPSCCVYARLSCQSQGSKHHNARICGILALKILSSLTLDLHIAMNVITLLDVVLPHVKDESTMLPSHSKSCVSPLLNYILMSAELHQCWPGFVKMIQHH